MIFIWRGAGILTLFAALIGVGFSWLFLTPGTAGYKGTAFLIATICNFFIQQSEGSLFFIPIKFWTIIFLGATIWGYFFSS